MDYKVVLHFGWGRDVFYLSKLANARLVAKANKDNGGTYEIYRREPNGWTQIE